MSSNLVGCTIFFMFKTPVETISYSWCFFVPVKQSSKKQIVPKDDLADIWYFECLSFMQLLYYRHSVKTFKLFNIRFNFITQCFTAWIFIIHCLYFVLRHIYYSAVDRIQWFSWKTIRCYQRNMEKHPFCRAISMGLNREFVNTMLSDWIKSNFKARI